VCCVCFVFCSPVSLSSCSFLTVPNTSKRNTEAEHDETRRQRPQVRRRACARAEWVRQPRGHQTGPCQPNYLRVTLRPGLSCVGPCNADEFFPCCLHQLVPGGPCDKGANSLIHPNDHLILVDGVPVSIAPVVTAFYQQ